MPQAQTYQSEFTGVQMDERFRAVATLAEALTVLEQAIAAKYTKPASGIPSTDMDADVNAALAKANSAIQSLADYYTKSEVDAMVAAVNAQEYIDVATLPAASADTLGKIYLVGPTSGEYARYITTVNGSTYGWVQIGTTEISMANYATKAELSQLDQKVDELLDGVPTEQTLTRYSRVQNASLKTTGVVETITSASSIVALFGPINGGSVLKVSGRVGASANSCLVCFYDVDDNFIAGSASYPTSGAATPVLDYEVTAPANAVWMRVSGNTTFEYSPSAKLLVAGVGIPERVDDLENEVGNLKSVNPGFDLRGMPHEVINGFYIATSSQKWTAADGGVEHIFKVKKGQIINIITHATLSTNYAFLTSYSSISDGSTPAFLSGYGTTIALPADQTITVEIPADCFLAVNCATSSNSTRYPQHIYINGDNPFFGLKSVWQGPSTMYGLGTSPLSTRFSERVARYLCMSHTNYAENGSTIAKKPDSYESAFGSLADFNAAVAGGLVDTSKTYLVKDSGSAPYPWTIYYYDGTDWVSVTRTATNVQRSPMVDRLSELDADADVIVFLGGSNDFMYDWTEIGEDTDRINTTIKGAMHLICQYLVTNFPNKFIIWINAVAAYRYQGDHTTPFSENNLGYTGWEEGEAVREVLKQYSIPYIDMAGEGGLTPENSGWWDDYDSAGTRVHPNAAGYLRLTKYLVSKMLDLKKLVV